MEQVNCITDIAMPQSRNEFPKGESRLFRNSSAPRNSPMIKRVTVTSTQSQLHDGQPEKQKRYPNANVSSPHRDNTPHSLSTNPRRPFQHAKSHFSPRMPIPPPKSDTTAR